MHIDTYDITAPAISGEAFSEAEALGSSVWLWMHSSEHRDAPLQALSTLLLPAIKTGQFILAVENAKPVFFLSWAMLNEEAESRYLNNPPHCMREADWVSGERMWILDWIAPFGHSRAMSRLLERDIFAKRWMRALYHRGNAKGLRVKTFKGIAVMPEEARYWFEAHPIATTISNSSRNSNDFTPPTTEGKSKP